MGQDGPVPVDDVELASRLRVAVARMARQLRQRTNAGLTPSQLSALLSVDALGPVRLGDLAAREAVAPPTLTKIVAGMVELGLVERRTDPADARSARISMTDAGRTALDTVRAERVALLVERFGRLPDDQRPHLEVVVILLEALVDDRTPSKA